MSYAEQLFSQMGVNTLIYANDLAFFGFDSYVYKNPQLMMSILKSPVALDNSVCAFYVMVWCKENGIVFTNYAKVGQQISFHHAGIGLNITLDIADIQNSKLTLVAHDIDFSMRPSLYGDKVTVTSTTDTVPAESKLYSNWQSLQWLNSTAINGKWWSKKYTLDNFNTSTDVDDKTMFNMCGFLYGLDSRFISAMATDSTTSKKINYLTVADIRTGLKLFADDYSLGGGLTLNTMRKTSKFWSDTYKGIIYNGTINKTITAPLQSNSKKVQDTLTSGLQYNISNWITGGGTFDIASVSESATVPYGSGQNHIAPIIYKMAIQY